MLYGLYLAGRKYRLGVIQIFFVPVDLKKYFCYIILNKILWKIGGTWLSCGSSSCKDRL